MKIKTSDLTLLALDWAAAKCEVGEDISEIDDPHFYSTDWAQGGPIIEREGIEVIPPHDDIELWEARIAYYEYYGPTPLIAAMRCYVASVLGDEVDIPEELQ